LGRSATAKQNKKKRLKEASLLTVVCDNEMFI
jgi:hypothetical protein